MRFCRLLPILPLLLPPPLLGQSADALRASVESAVLPTFWIAEEGPEPVPLARRMEALGVPGVSVAVMRDGRIFWARGFGYADVSTSRPVTPETLFQAASISKPVAALAAMRLVEAGSLDLDRDVNEQLESWRLPDNAHTTREKVTLRRLLNHTAGTTVWGFPGYAPGEDVPTTVGVLDGLGNTEAVRVYKEPGISWQYSGGGYTIAQLMMAEAAGGPFPDVMRRLVLEPVGMGRSTYEQPLPESLAHLAALGYRRDGRPVGGGRHTYPEMAAAGLWTTPTDLLRFALALQRARAGAPDALLSQPLAREMLTAGLNGHGLGPGVGEDGTFGHGGSNAGFRSQLTAFLDREDGVAVMTNSDTGGRLAAEIILTVADAMGWESPKPDVKTVVELDPADLDRLAGTYRDAEQNVEATVVVDGRGLVLRVVGETWPLLPTSATEFFATSTGQPAVFVIEGDSVAVRLGQLSAVKVR